MKNLKLNLKGLYGYRQSLLSRSPQPRDNHEMSERRPSEERTLLALLPQRFARYAAMLIMLLTIGVGQMWAKNIYVNRGDWGNDSYYVAIYAFGSSSVDAQWYYIEEIDATNHVYYANIDDSYTKMNLVRLKPSTTAAWGNKERQTNDITLSTGDNAKNYYVINGWGESSYVTQQYWDPNTVIYVDATYIDTKMGNWGSNIWLRVGNGSANSAWKVNNSAVNKVNGTESLYKMSSGTGWANYTKLYIANNCGDQSSGKGIDYSSSKGSGTYLITQQAEAIIDRSSTSRAYTVILHDPSKDGYTGGDGCYYYKRDEYNYRKTFTITNTSVANATVELYYWDESNVRQVVAEGASAEVLPTTKVWCRVMPDEGYAIPKVMISDPTEREWTDASEDAKGRNLYVVRTNVTFRAVVEPLATKTILIKDVNGWAPNMYFKGWNPFQYSGYNNVDYYITTQKISTVDKVHLCGADYYAVTFTNEFPFYYIHNDGENRTDFFTYSKLTHMNKYDNTTSGDGAWGLHDPNCSDAIYWVETTKDTKHYISNVVGNTTDTLSFYAESGSTVDFHAGASDPVNVYSTAIAPFFGTGQKLDGKVGAVFTAKSTGSGLTEVDVFEGDYDIHVNATTENFLTNGESNSGTTGTKFIKFETNSLFGDEYDHYWVDWFPSGGAKSVVATVGNKFNANLAGVLGSDEFAPKGMTQSTGGNVRYGYNPETNYFKRAIVDAGDYAVQISSPAAGKVMISNDGGSTYTQDAFSETCYLADATNWNYQAFAKVKGQARATAKTSYVAGIQVMTDNKQLIGGETGDDYVVVITYDFKTNRFIAAWKPVAPFEGFDLQSNLMVVRTEDGNPTVLNIVDQNGDSKVNPLSSISKVYTVLELLQDNWNSTASPYSSRPYAKRRVVSGGYTDEYYWISLPYDCLVKDIFGIEGYGNGDSNEDSWVLQTYRGDLRAEKGWWAETNAWWYDMDRGDTLKANEGYVLRVTNLNGEGVGTKRFAGVSGGKLYLYFPSHASDTTIGPLAGTVTTHLDSLKCTKWHKRPKDLDPTEGDNNPIYDRRAVDSNWRIIGSPSFNSTKISAPVFIFTDEDLNGDLMVDDKDYKIAYDNYIKENGPYSLKYFYNWEVEANTPKFTIANAATTEFKATHAHLVQYAGDITWEAYDASNPLVGLKAPKRQQDASNEQTLRLVLQQGTREADVAYISRMAFGATMGYDLNMDLSKMINANSANIYTMGELYKMAGNCIPDTVTVLPVGVRPAADGSYTFAMPEGTYGTGVILVDKVANTRTNLALTDYTVTLSAGTYDERFELELSPIAQTPTDIENVQGDDVRNAQVRKVMVDGVLFIVKDDIIFDARGNRLQ